MDMTFYGLLHINTGEKSTANGSSKKFEHQIETYIMNAVNLAHSLASKGIEFILLTNQPATIDCYLDRMSAVDRLQVKQIDFATQVPTGTSFYSAHFKIDMFKYLGSLPADRYVGAIDLDTIAIGEISPCFQNSIRAKIPIVYEIADQVIPVFGRDRILQDLQKLLPSIREVRWSGGEFMTGTPDFFSSLAAEIDKIYDRYIRTIDSLHHQGDEMLTNAALAALRHQGQFQIADGGDLGIVGRFWSYPPKHPQPSFRNFEHLFLLHLPSDKQFLARLDPEDARCRDRFLDRYHRYLPQQVAKSTVHSKTLSFLKWLRLK
jgi:hypothetical protein